MIVPMKKVSLVVLDREKDGSLEKLRELGVMHLEQKNVQSGELTKLLERRARTESALGILRSYPLPKGVKPESVPHRRKTDRPNEEDY
jgi:V/A-type H+-transporting ATPase subunit I